MTDCTASVRLCELLSTLIEGIHIIQITKFSSVVALVLCIYDFVLTYDDEIVFMRGAELGIAKTVYFTVRYLTVIVMTFINTGAKSTEHIGMPIMIGTSSRIPGTCIRRSLSWIRFHWITGVIIGTLTEVPLLLRVYALYNKDRRVLIFTLTCLSATSLSMLGISSKVMQTEQATMVNFGPGPDMRMCIPKNLNVLYKFFWIPLLINEAILLSFALAKWFRSFQQHGLQSSAINVIVRDSVLYFVGTFPFFLLSHFMWVIGGEDYIEFPVGFAICMGSIMSQKIVVNMRKYRHGHANVIQNEWKENSGGDTSGLASGKDDLEMAHLGFSKVDADSFQRENR